MRFDTRSTWMRIVILFAVYTLAPTIPMIYVRMTESWESGFSFALINLFAILPLATISLAISDGLKEGFSILWAVAPFVSFLAPMFTAFNESALFYGVVYSILGVVANGAASFFRKDHNTSLDA